ncbi:MAG: hypothetical protein ABJB12_09815 [Pseudomonadota bacterium]
MKGAGNERLLRALGLLGLGAIAGLACGGPQEQAGRGAVCFRTEDCQVGFACVPEAAGSSKRVCGNDLTLIVSTVDGAPPEADGGAGPSAGGAPTAGGAASNAGGGMSAGAAMGGAAMGGAAMGGAAMGGAGGSGTGG